MAITETPDTLTLADLDTLALDDLDELGFELDGESTETRLQKYKRWGLLKARPPWWRRARGR